jgi:hypothetical protein
MATSLVSLGALAFAAPIGAHHSISTVDITTPVWVKGTVVRYEIGNPHTMIELDATTADGQSVDHRRTDPGKSPTNACR